MPFSEATSVQNFRTFTVYVNSEGSGESAFLHRLSQALDDGIKFFCLILFVETRASVNVSPLQISQIPAFIA